VCCKYLISLLISRDSQLRVCLESEMGILTILKLLRLWGFLQMKEKIFTLYCEHLWVRDEILCFEYEMLFKAYMLNS
jgi:hypothetical protein